MYCILKYAMQVYRTYSFMSNGLSTKFYSVKVNQVMEMKGREVPSVLKWFKYTCTKL